MVCYVGETHLVDLEGVMGMRVIWLDGFCKIKTGRLCRGIIFHSRSLGAKLAHYILGYDKEIVDIAVQNIVLPIRLYCFHSEVYNMR